VFAVERDVAVGTVDVGHELPAPQLHELVDPGARTVQCLDDRAIARRFSTAASIRNSSTSSCRRSARR